LRCGRVALEPPGGASETLAAAAGEASKYGDLMGFNVDDLGLFWVISMWPRKQRISDNVCGLGIADEDFDG